MIDITKKYQTRLGRPVVLLSDRGPGVHSIVGYIVDDKHIETWSPRGEYDIGVQNSLDLIEVPAVVEVEFWVNVYSNGMGGYCHSTKAQADRETDKTRIACINIKRTVTVGEGL